MSDVGEAQRQGQATGDTAPPLESPDEADIQMRCPLCGRPSTHLFGCKGCGGDAWGWEFEALYGEEAVTALRTHLTQTLTAAGMAPEQVGRAVRHSYVLGGCLVCADCWRHTLPAAPLRPWRSSDTCPLLFLGERWLEGEGWMPTAYLAALWAGQDWTTWRAAVEAAWCDPQEKIDTAWDAIAHWRRTLLTAALSPRRSAVGGPPSSHL